MSLFGPSRPHWLDQALQRKPKLRAKSRIVASNPAPVSMYGNAVYYPNYRASTNQPPSSLRLDIISHVFYAFASIGDDGTVYLSSNADTTMIIDGEQGCLRAFAKLKQQWGHLKLIISIGGAEGSPDNFAKAAGDPAKRVAFASSARSLIDQYQFDGIDIDWEHPHGAQQSADYMQLLACLRSYLPAPRYVLTTALPAGQWILGNFDLPQLASYIDLLNLMAYDFVGNWGDPIVSGHQAQLYAPQGGGSTQAAISYLVSQGFPANKILLGCPTYGRSFLNCNNINQICNSCGGADGTFDYSELPRANTQESVDEGSVAAYCVGGDGGFVSYDNPRTIQLKAKYIKDNGLAGLFFWHALADGPGARSLILTGYTELHS